MKSSAVRSGKRAAYPAYKPSGMEWVGDIPEHWEVHRLKHVASIQFSSVDKHTIEGEEPVRLCNYVDVYYNDFIKEGLEFMPATATRSEIARFQLRHGDVLVTKDSESWDDIAVPAYVAEEIDGVLCGYHLAHIRPDLRKLIGEYLFRAFRSCGINDQFRVATNGITRFGLGKYWLDNGLFPVPPLKEQRTIASFLDRETARIDALIEKKQRQIELLQEKRSALVHLAIHNPDTQNLRLSYVADKISRPINRQDEKVYTPVGLYNWARGIFHKEPMAGIDLGDSDFFWVKADDLILSGQFAWEGAVALASKEEDGCVVSHRYPVVCGKPELIDTAFLWAFFTSKHGHFLLDNHSRGAAGRNRPLNINTLMKEVIPVPPLNEQKKVADHVYFESKFKKIMNCSIELLQEHRTSLISAAVTGKIDVRKEIS